MNPKHLLRLAFPIFVWFVCAKLLKIDAYSTALLTIVSVIIAYVSYAAARKRREEGFNTMTSDLDKELRELIAEGDRDLTAIEDVAKSVKSKEVADKGMALFHLGEKIMAYLKANPAKITKARRFLNYYLDTAQEILTKYYAFEKNGIKAQAITELENKTAQALVTLNDSFKRQYLNLTSNERMDIEAEIDLLEKEAKLNL